MLRELAKMAHLFATEGTKHSSTKLQPDCSTGYVPSTVMGSNPYHAFNKMSSLGREEEVITSTKMFCFLVSKTTKELVLRWQEHKPVDISSEVKMPQFEIFMVIPDKCQETFHIGKIFVLHS